MGPVLTQMLTRPQCNAEFETGCCRFFKKKLGYIPEHDEALSSLRPNFKVGILSKIACMHHPLRRLPHAICHQRALQHRANVTCCPPAPCTVFCCAQDLVAHSTCTLDKELAASGFQQQHQAVLEEYSGLRSDSDDDGDSSSATAHDSFARSDDEAGEGIATCSRAKAQPALTAGQLHGAGTLPIRDSLPDVRSVASSEASLAVDEQRMQPSPEEAAPSGQAQQAPAHQGSGQPVDGSDDCAEAAAPETPCRQGEVLDSNRMDQAPAGALLTGSDDDVSLADLHVQVMCPRHSMADWMQQLYASCRPLLP